MLLNVGAPVPWVHVRAIILSILQYYSNFHSSHIFAHLRPYVTCTELCTLRKRGAIDGGSPCRLSILRDANVACLCRLFMPMSHVEFKKYPCHMSLYFLKPCRMSIGPMSLVEFKKWPRSPVKFKGQGPLQYY